MELPCISCVSDIAGERKLFRCPW